MGRVAEAYAALVAAGELKPDADQERAAQALDRFAADLGRTRTGFLSHLFGRETPAPSGVYLCGGVGRGKSMLMDLAFDTIDAEPKRRVHFAPFMLEVHERLKEARKGEDGDPVIEPPAVALRRRARRPPRSRSGNENLRARKRAARRAGRGARRRGSTRF